MFKIRQAIFGILFFSLLNIDVAAQNLSNLNCAELVIPESEKPNGLARRYVAYIFSSPGCGYSLKLKNDLTQNPLPDQLKVVFIEHHATLEKIHSNIETYGGHEVRTVETCPEWFTLYFPITILVKAETGKKVRRYRGYYPNMYDRMERKMK